jgi:hypothetical protein
MIPETLTIAERQILVNQYKLMSKIMTDGEDYETKIEILENGYTEQYYEVFEVATEEIPMEICEETTQILHMYRRINKAVSLLSEAEKRDLDLEKIKFEGFDAKHDLHYRYMIFMIEKMRMWREYCKVSFNSKNRQSILKYRKMLDYQLYLLENDEYELRKEDLAHMIDSLSSSAKKHISLEV